MSELPDTGPVTAAATGAWPPAGDGRQARPYPPRPGPAVRMPPDETELLGRARAKGAMDGWTGVLDQWSFDPASRPEYVTYLREECALAVAHTERSAATEAEAREGAAAAALPARRRSNRPSTMECSTLSRRRERRGSRVAFST